MQEKIYYRDPRNSSSRKKVKTQYIEQTKKTRIAQENHSLIKRNNHKERILRNIIYTRNLHIEAAINKGQTMTINNLPWHRSKPRRKNNFV